MPDTERPCSYTGIEEQYCVHLAEYGARNPGEMIHLGARKDGVEVVLWLCGLCWMQVTGSVLRGIAAETIERLAREGWTLTPQAAPVNPDAEDAALQQLLRERGGIMRRQEMPDALSAAVARGIKAGWLQLVAESYYALELAWKPKAGAQ